MDDDLKTRFEWVEAIRKACWDSYCSRREYEWKVSLAFWGALLGVLSIVANQDVSKLLGWQPARTVVQVAHLPICRVQLLQVLVFATTMVVLWLHICFMSFIRRGHFVDQKRYEACLEWQRALAVTPDPPEVVSILKDIDEERGEWRDETSPDGTKKRRYVLRFVRTHLFQLAITILLVCAANVLLFLRTP